MSKLFNDGLFDDIIEISPTVVRTVDNADKYVGKYPYFGEIYTVDDLVNLLRNTDLGDSNVFEDIWMKLYSKKFRFPLTKVNDYTVGSGLQDRAIASKINSNQTQINILAKLWRDRETRIQEYLNVTYTGTGETTGTAVGNVITAGKGTSKNDSNTSNETSNETTNDGTNNTVGNVSGTSSNESESHGTSKNVTDTTGHSTGKSGTVTSGTSSNNSTVEGTTSNKGTSENKVTEVRSDYPEASGLSGMNSPGSGLNPGTLGLDYISTGGESATKGTTSNTGTNKSTTNSSGTTSGKSDVTTSADSTGKSTSNGESSDNSTSSGAHNTDNTSNNTSHSEGTSRGTSNTTYGATGETTSDTETDSKNDTTGTSKSEGRSKDLIALSGDFQRLNERQKLVDYIIGLISKELAVTVTTVDVTFWNDQIDPFTGEWM